MPTEPAGLNIKPDTRFGRPATRIALVINHIIGRAGGAERIFVELANMLAARGYEVSCVYFEKRDGKPYYPLDRRVELVNLCPKFSPPHTFPFSLLTSKPFPIEVRNMARWRQNKGPIISLLRDYYRATRPDVAISFLPPANTLALLASVGTPVKVIPTNHNVLTRDY